MGQTVTLYLMDGNLEGVIQAKLPNWQGVVYKGKIVDIMGKKDDLPVSGVWVTIKDRQVYTGWSIDWLGGATLLDSLYTQKELIGDEDVYILSSSDTQFIQPQILVELVEQFKGIIEENTGYDLVDDLKIKLDTCIEVKSQVEEFLGKVGVLLDILNFYSVGSQTTNILGEDTSDFMGELDSKGHVMYVYGDLLKIKCKGVDAKGRLNRGNFDLLRGSKIINKQDSNIDPLTSLLRRDVEFFSIESATKYIFSDLFDSTDVGYWQDINGNNYSDMYEFEIPEGSIKVSYESNVGNIEAEGYALPDNKFLLLSGSKVTDTDIEDSRYYDKIKDRGYIQDNLHKVERVTKITTEHILFNTSSAAALFVTLQSRSGLATWKDEEGNYLNSLT